MKSEYNNQGIGTNYGIIDNLESKLDKVQKEISEDNAQYTASFNTEEVPERNYDNSEVKLEYIATLDYFPHNLPKTVVKRDSMYNLHIVNAMRLKGEDINYEIRGFWEIGQYSGTNIVNTGEVAIGSGQPKHVDKHEDNHDRIKNEEMNRFQDKSEGLTDYQV